MPKLNALNCWNTGISNAGVESMRAHPTLTSWNLGKTKIADGSVSALSTLSRLSNLDIIKTAITPAGFEQLKKALPKCRIESDHGTYEPK
jgi:hypothetical protein